MAWGYPEDVDILSRPVTSRDWTNNQNLINKTSTESDDFTSEFYKTFKAELGWGIAQ